MDDNSLKLVVVIAKAYKSYIGRVHEHLKSLGFSGSEFGALEYLYNRKESVTAQELAKKILLTTGTTTYTIDKLVKRGLIKKKENGLDKRFLEITLTNQGKKIIQETFPKHEAFLKKLNHLSPEDTQSLISLLKKLGKKE